MTEVPKTGQERSAEKWDGTREPRNSVSIPVSGGGGEGVAANHAFRQHRDPPSKTIGAGALGTVKMEHGRKKCLERRSLCIRIHAFAS